MTGDLQDFKARLRLTLPGNWFADSAPVLDGLLTGMSAAWVILYDLLGFVRQQTRIGTAAKAFLDLAAVDFFGTMLKRRSSESDDALRGRLRSAMRRERATRASIIDAAAQAGYSVWVFEPARPADTGAYNVAAGLAWGSTGAWGSLEMPFECLLVAHAGPTAFATELWPGVAAAMPAGGAAWLRIEN